jgi:hypothetical protein
MNPGVAAAMGSMSMGPGSMGMNMLATSQGSQETHSISGARTEGQAILLDNTNVQGFWNRGMGSGAVGSSLGIEAVANLQVLTSSYDARFGGNGSVANAVTKSGTNAFHGSVYEYLRNSALNARNFFDTTAIRRRLEETSLALAWRTAPEGQTILLFQLRRTAPGSPDSDGLCS